MPRSSEASSQQSDTGFGLEGFGDRDIAASDEDLFISMMDMSGYWNQERNMSNLDLDAASSDFDFTWANANDIQLPCDITTLDKAPHTLTVLQSPNSMTGTEGHTSLQMSQPQDLCKRRRPEDVSDRQTQPSFGYGKDFSDPSLGAVGSEEYPNCQWLKSISEVASALDKVLGTAPLPLDSLLAAEQKLVSLQQASANDCSLNTELIITSLVASLLDMLKAQFRDFCSTDGPNQPKQKFSPVRGMSGSDTGLHVGRSRVTDDVAQKCVRAMVKRRLRNHFQILNGKVQKHCDSSEMLSSAVRLAAGATIREVETLLGMLNLQ
ncbi:hypothetical protein B0A50_07266 [Salinomyces thailandicus]|uniref:Uncharacterized protein n=1 Tax=Salinomyces thailandicus TaxID=706561 RepID=A0A4U0TN35_9PEZI|nr:hypothetical protein B0A50_07266 [Salinomyces thailandica]